MVVSLATPKECAARSAKEQCSFGHMEFRSLIEGVVVSSSETALQKVSLRRARADLLTTRAIGGLPLTLEF